jgi:hypothetical protein
MTHRRLVRVSTDIGPDRAPLSALVNELLFGEG